MFEYLLPDYTCILVEKNSKKVIFQSKENSVRPLVRYSYYHEIFGENTILIDKIVGSAIANVIIHLNIKQVYTKIISKPALKLLNNKNIKVIYEEIVDNILRKDKTDICPLEKKILSVSSPLEAYNILVEVVINQNPVHIN